MKKSKTTKRSLLMSVLSMLMCVAMLIGSTFAWFSDSVSTGVNTITAGNLDVDIVDAEEGDTKGQSLEGKSIFKEKSFLWEPGAMQVSKKFAIKNKGTLAFWYTLSLNAEKKAEGEDLLDVVKMKVVKAKDFTLMEKIGEESPGVTQEERKTAWEAITSEKEFSSGTLDPNTSISEPLVVVLYWEPDSSTALDSEENPDNKYNVEGEQLTASFSVDVYATQTSYEKDSFGNTYDENAKAEKLVTKAVVDGFASLNGIFSARSDIGGITVEPMTWNEDAGRYECTFDFAAENKGVLNAFNATKDAITKAIIDEKKNIASVAIGEQEAITITEALSEEELGSQLLSNLLSELEAGGRADAENFKGQTIEINVDVTTTGGNTITYKLTFDMSKVTELNLN